MPRPKGKPLTCQRCDKEIYGVELRHVVRLSGGVMHGTCHADHRKQVGEMIAEAIAAGRHSVRDQSHPTVAEIRQKIEREQLARLERRRASLVNPPTPGAMS